MVGREVCSVLHWPKMSPKRLWSFPEERDMLALGHAWIEFCAPREVPAMTRQDGQSFWMHPEPMPEPFPDDEPPVVISSRVILWAMNEFLSEEGRWESTGCFHRAALFDPRNKRFLTRSEDIGRHNCLDRLGGWALARGFSLRGQVLFLSARVTASLAEKAARAGFCLIISRSAVTTASLDMARDLDLTLVGFAREGRLTVFCDGPGRIVQ